MNVFALTSLPLSLVFVKALLGQIARLQNGKIGTLPGHNVGTRHPDPDAMTLRLGSNIRGEVPIPPPDTAPTAMTAALITEPAEDVGHEFRRANHCVIHVMPGRSGRKRRKTNRWSILLSVWCSNP